MNQKSPSYPRPTDPLLQQSREKCLCFSHVVGRLAVSENIRNLCFCFYWRKKKEEKFVMEGKLIIDKAHSNLAGRSRNKTSGQKQLEKFGSEKQLRISCYMWITQMERSHFYLNGMIHKVERRVRSWTREEISHFQVQLQQPCEKWHVGGFFFLCFAVKHRTKFCLCILSMESTLCHNETFELVTTGEKVRF